MCIILHRGGFHGLSHEADDLVLLTLGTVDSIHHMGMWASYIGMQQSCNLFPISIYGSYALYTVLYLVNRTTRTMVFIRYMIWCGIYDNDYCTMYHVMHGAL